MTSFKTFIIAEAGINHNGNINRAFKMIDIAASVGADAIKFQSFVAKELVHKNTKLADYQKNKTEINNQQKLLQKYEFSFDQQLLLSRRAKLKKIEFMSTPFDKKSLEHLLKLKINRIKVSSSDLNNLPFLVDIGMTGKKVIFSTGMGTLKEIRNAISAILFGRLKKRQPINKKEFILFNKNTKKNKKVLSFLSILHCTSLYPCPIDKVNLRFMNSLREFTNCDVGFSDHTKDIIAPIIAVANGAKIIEKHFTLNKKLNGPDHSASINIPELKKMIKNIRSTEQIMGVDYKIVSKKEKKVSIYVRKTISAKIDILKGDKFSYSNLTTIRSGKGMSPELIWKLIGQKSKKNYLKGELIV